MAKNKLVGAAALTAALAGGGALGMVLGTPVVSGAQTEEPSTTTAPETTTTPPETTVPETPAPDDGATKPEDCEGGRGFGHRGGFADLAVAAVALGITEDELRTQLRAGSSIAEIATAQGVELQTVIDALVADATAEIDQKVTDGDLTAEQAAERKAGLTERITELVQNEGLREGPGHRGS
jgi:hypothetical protein